MSVPDVHQARTLQPIPRPRPPEASARPAADRRWLQPERHTAGAHPSTEYWDVMTASWRSRDPHVR